jgi:peptidoglycan-associated lipoprotein
MSRKVMMVVLALLLIFSGSIMLSSCAKEAVKDTEALTADEKAKRDAAEKARLERERMERERALREQQLREGEAARLKQEFENKAIYFEFDSAVLGTEAQDVLREKADYLKANADKKVLIEGHCDDRGSVEYNLALGQRRAESAMKYLVILGISSDRIRTISYGKERPVDPGQNEEAWAMNRRDEFVLE